MFADVRNRKPKIIPWSTDYVDKTLFFLPFDLIFVATFVFQLVLMELEQSLKMDKRT